MIEFFKTSGDKLARIDNIEDNCWVSVTAPTEEELFRVSAKMGVGLDFLKASLDEEETSRIETNEKNTLILIGIPCALKFENTVSYSVQPLSIIITEHNIMTVALKRNTILSDFSDGLIKNVQTEQKTAFVLQILMHMSARFLQYLRQINKITGFIENQLYGSLRNKELVQLYDLGKSLIYFSATLKANEITLEKILRGRVIRLTSDEHDLLEDVLIEIKQAVDMADIYSDILSKTTEAFTTVRSNNLNHVVKMLISIVVVLAIPLIITGFCLLAQSYMSLYRMIIPVAASILLMAAVGIILYKKKMF